MSFPYKIIAPDMSKLLCILSYSSIDISFLSRAHFTLLQDTCKPHCINFRCFGIVFLSNLN